MSALFAAVASVPASETESVNTENQNGEDEKTPCCGPLWWERTALCTTSLFKNMATVTTLDFTTSDCCPLWCDRCWRFQSLTSSDLSTNSRCHISSSERCFLYLVICSKRQTIHMFILSSCLAMLLTSTIGHFSCCYQLTPPVSAPCTSLLQPAFCKLWLLLLSFSQKISKSKFRSVYLWVCVPAWCIYIITLGFVPALDYTDFCS